jgi:thiol-disulfide isomerase/thioredoxin
MRPHMRPISYPIRLAFTSIAIASLYLAMFPSLQPQAYAANTAAANAKLFRIGFMDTQGKVRFLHDFKGRPVVINLWASWCAPCVEEMPSLSTLQQDTRAQGLVVIALSEDDSMAQAVAFYKAHGITNLVPFFDKQHLAWLALTQNVPASERGIPITMLISRNGTTLKTYAGPVNWQTPDMHKELQALVQ